MNKSCSWLVNKSVPRKCNHSVSSDGPVIITSFVVPLCFLLEILEYFFPEFLFQAIAVKSEQAFQAVPGTEKRGTKIHLVSLAQRNRGGGTG